MAIQVRTAREAVRCETRYGLEASTRSAAQIVCRDRNNVQRVSKRMTRFQIIISNNENVLQLQNKLQTIQ